MRHSYLILIAKPKRRSFNRFWFLGWQLFSAGNTLVLLQLQSGPPLQYQCSTPKILSTDLINMLWNICSYSVELSTGNPSIRAPTGAFSSTRTRSIVDRPRVEHGLNSQHCIAAGIIRGANWGHANRDGLQSERSPERVGHEWEKCCPWTAPICSMCRCCYRFSRKIYDTTWYMWSMLIVVLKWMGAMSELNRHKHLCECACVCVCMLWHSTQSVYGIAWAPFHAAPTIRQQIEYMSQSGVAPDKKVHRTFKYGVLSGSLQARVHSVTEQNKLAESW